LESEVSAEGESKRLEPVVRKRFDCSGVLKSRVVASVVGATEERVLVDKDEPRLAPLSEPTIGTAGGALQVANCGPENVGSVDGAHKNSIFTRNPCKLHQPGPLCLQIDVSEDTVVDDQVERGFRERQRRLDSDLNEAGRDGDAVEPLD
jgi:hypothetical protein